MERSQLSISASNPLSSWTNYSFTCMVFLYHSRLSLPWLLFSSIWMDFFSHQRTTPCLDLQPISISFYAKVMLTSHTNDFLFILLCTTLKKTFDENCFTRFTTPTSIISSIKQCKSWLHANYRATSTLPMPHTLGLCFMHCYGPTYTVIL